MGYEEGKARQLGGLTWVALSGREVCPTIIVAHADTSPAETVRMMSRLSDGAPAETSFGEPDIEWDPPAKGESIPEEFEIDSHRTIGPFEGRKTR